MVSITAKKKKWHDLRYTKVYGEASEADEEAATMWTSENVQELLSVSLLTSITQTRQHFIFELYSILHMSKNLLANWLVVQRLQEIG